MAKIVFIRVKALVPVSQMDPEDTAVAGLYRVRLNDSTPQEGLANAALDGFHSNVAVGVLDDFEFIVTAGLDGDSEILVSSDAFEGYSLAPHALQVTRVDASASSA